MILATFIPCMCAFLKLVTLQVAHSDIIAECLSTRQLILHRISPSVCVCVCRCRCHASGVQFTCGYSTMCNSSYTRHTPGQVPAYVQRPCTYGHRCSNRMNSVDRGKGSRGRKTVVIQKDSVNFNFSVNLLAMASTINFHMLSQSLFKFHTI